MLFRQNLANPWISQSKCYFIFCSVFFNWHTYILSIQGRFELLSLSGSFTPTDSGGGTRSRSGGMSVSLAAADGRVIGGGVAGLLVAASPVQVRDAIVEPRKRKPVVYYTIDE
jgi:predicted DNA-binding protein with PD1-like motif